LSFIVIGGKKSFLLNWVYLNSTQYDRFSKKFQKVLDGYHEDDDFNRNKDGKDIGTHSLRKGAATYAGSGSTAAPSLAAIAARAGWQLSQVLTKYIKHCDAGNHFVGRTVSGLSIHDESFALMPQDFLKST
jgi:hypothetical protein